MREPCSIDVTSLEDTDQRIVMGMLDSTAEITVELENQIIQLDPTTMKRIARFNLEKENEKLVEEIKEHKKNIESIKAKYRELNERLQSMRDIGADIWENGTEYAERKEYEESDWND